MKVSPLLSALFIFFAVGVGLYPLVYLFLDMSGGLLASKPDDLLNSPFWNICFYGHISLGGLALLSGCSQFFKKFRNKHLRLHRKLGFVYVISVMLSGLFSLYIAYYTPGGIVAVLGFEVLGILWLYTTFNAFRAVLQKNLDQHENWMMRSYALTFAAVSLRLWMPILIGLIGLSFIQAYIIIAWWCWVPNLMVAQWFISKKYKRAQYKAYL